MVLDPEEIARRNHNESCTRNHKVTQDHKIVTHWLDHLIFISIQNQFLFNVSLNFLKMCG